MPSSGLREASRSVPVGVGLFTGFRREDRTLTSLADAANQIELVRDSGYGYALFTYEYTFSFLRRARTQTKESYFPIQQITSQL